MLEAFIIILVIFVAFVFVTMKLISMIFSSVGGFLSGRVGQVRQPAGVSPPAGAWCGNARCRADNPSHARFCRRCGKTLPGVFNLPVAASL